MARLEHQLRRLNAGQSLSPEDFHHRNQENVAYSQILGHSSSAEPDFPDLIRLEAGGEGQFLGASSGMQLARSVLESASRRKSTAFTANESPRACGSSVFENTACITTYDLYDARNFELPAWEDLFGVVSVYFCHYGVQYAIITQEELMKHAYAVYSKSDGPPKSGADPRSVLILYMVLSISLHLSSNHDPELSKRAEIARRIASSHLGNALRTKDHRAVQCLLLVLLSSTLSSESAPMWYISGICMRMCVDLGYHSEQTIRYNANDTTDPELDVKRRLFWVAYTLDRGLAKMLGRPFFIEDARIDVQLPSTSVAPETRQAVAQWLSMQRLQSDIVRRIYAPRNRDVEATADYKSTMDSKLAGWLEACKEAGLLECQNLDWWEYWYNHAKLILHQPRPSSTNESLAEAFEASKMIIRLSFIRAHSFVEAFGWLDIHLQLVSGLTLIFLVLKSSHVRELAQKDWTSFRACIVEWQVLLDKLGGRWPLIFKTKTILGRLADDVITRIQDGNGGHHTKPTRTLRRSSERFVPKHHACLTWGASRRVEVDATQILSPVTYAEETLSEVRIDARSQAGSSTDHHGDATVQRTQNNPDGSIKDYEPDTSHQRGEPSSNTHIYDQDFTFDDVEFPSVLGSELFDTMNELGLPLADSGLRDRSNHIMNTPLDNPFGFSWIDAQTTLTDSVLNFQPNHEPDQTRMFEASENRSDCLWGPN